MITFSQKCLDIAKAKGKVLFRFESNGKFLPKASKHGGSVKCAMAVSEKDWLRFMRLWKSMIENEQRS